MFGKSRFYRKYLLLAGLAALAGAGAVFAYSPHYTHPDLTEEMVKFYNASEGQKIGGEFLQVLRRGSINEDTDPRWINHFYDPQSGEGWTGEHLGPHGKEMVQGISNTLVAMNFTPLPAPKWAEDQEAQNKFIDYGWNHTWQKAIYDYANGDKEKAFESLGYVLHLIEDMSVPDHTRNDSHPHVAGDPGSPYEEWAKLYTNNNKLDTAEKLLGEKAATPQFFNLKGAFDYTAKYSNENFFSEETIVDSKYNLPKHDYEKFFGTTKFYYKTDIFGDYPIAKRTQDNQGNLEYTLTDELILSSYFSRLSRRAVLAGAGVIELFFKEAERAKHDPSILEKPPAPPTAMGTIGTMLLTRVVSPLGLISPLARGIYRAFNNLRSALFASVSKISPNEPQVAVEPNPPSQGETRAPNLAVKPPSGTNLDVGRLSEPPDSSTSDVGASLTSDVSPPGGVEEGSVTSPLLQGGGRGGEDLPPFLQLHAAGGGVAGFGGGAPAPSTSDVLTSSTSDVTPPDISLDVSECPGLASVSGECLVASSTATVSWSSAAGDLNHYIIECEKLGAACSGFNFASTAATSTVYSLPADDATYIFKAKAVDNAENESAQTTKTVVFFTRPVVINEIAWAGTASNAADEWIELYNRSSKSVNLASWVLYAEDSVPYINLSGTISAGGYYLIERTDNDSVSDVAADLTAPFSGSGAGSGLGNGGETLVLSRASTTVDQNVLCSNAWCGGFAAPTYSSMERIDMEVAGTDTGNWGTSNGVVKNGLDSAGAALTATPRARNSLHYLISQSATLSSDKTLKQSFGTYIIKNNETLTIASGKTLTIEPGVTAKMGDSADLIVDGILKSDGTGANNILFTALSSSPAAGSWRNVRITSASQNSSVSHTRFKYGGGFASNIPSERRALLSVIDNSITISNSIFENSFSAGARLTISNSTIQNNTFSAGTTTADNVGLYVVGGAPTVSGNTFSENYFGAKMEGAAASYADNVFNNNISYALYSSNGSSTFSGNSGAGNGKNGIALLGTISAAGGTTTLASNSLAYITTSSSYAEIAAGASLVLQAGARFSGEDSSSRLTVNGALKLEGASKDSIIFTSLADAAPGEWYGIVVNSGGYLYGGGFTLRYGGFGAGGNPNAIAGIGVFGGSVSLSDGRIENNYKAGMRLYDHATSTLTNFEFNNHTSPASNSTALVVANAGVILNTVSFSDNFLGVSSSNSTIQATDVTFSGNTTDKSPANAF
ncbi:hypothetical protein A3B19_03280 [Candidatus Giovannonibacteria bacterium RIFCSPLOWO2_01_FULL_46_32]|uniref:LTD domain-containing protein n=1 Tax=Candidatus Giovannonibacteria bacterium RIFCSPLOWO2_01_FULL_46_32 TaxID=1798353 RepID=A0A1F5XH78_9BACT|nr:MAG: hypothetical protein A3B19_03280 [Candidatus Giovannonibacteria bacterium RIFCSPLOWO2_01_FULL_46_32]